jgi:hypothetical protein
LAHFGSFRLKIYECDLRKLKALPQRYKFVTSTPVMLKIAEESGFDIEHVVVWVSPMKTDPPISLD